MKILTPSLAAASLVLVSNPAQAVVLASYEFSGASAAATIVATDITASAFTINNALTNSSFSSGGNIFSRVNGTTASTLAEAITETQFVTVTIGADSGFQLDLTSLTVDLGYSLAIPEGIGKTLAASVFSSVDGFAVADVLGTSTVASTVDTSGEPGGIAYQNLNIDLTGAAYQDLTGPLEFRIYVYDNENTLTQPIHRVDNFVLNGEISAIPEPSTALLGSLAMFGLLRRRR